MSIVADNLLLKMKITAKEMEIQGTPRKATIDILKDEYRNGRVLEDMTMDDILGEYLYRKLLRCEIGLDDGARDKLANEMKRRLDKLSKELNELKSQMSTL